MRAVALPRAARIAFALLVAAAGMLLFSAPKALADNCPPIANKPGQVPHVSYDGMQKLTYCYGPLTIKPGQNVIHFNTTHLFPQVPGYITRFDPEFVYADGTVPRVDVLHLHHAVWIVNGNPQFAAGEEKTIVQEPEGFGWRTRPSDTWVVNDMLHDLVGESATVYLVWRIDFVPDSAPSAAAIHTVHTQWMDVSGPNPKVGISSQIYPVFDALKGMGNHGKYVFPDQASAKQQAYIGPRQTWTPNQPVTLIGSAGHLHPGGLYTQLDVTRGDKTRRIFRSKAHYYEPAGEVSWDVAMGGTPADWRVQLDPGDQLSVHAAYDTKRASWYDVMGIMPVSVYNGTDVGGVGPFNPGIPQKNVLTHTHLDENRHHGGKRDPSLRDPIPLPNGVNPVGPIDIQDYTYAQGDLAVPGKAGRPPIVKQGHSLKFLNLDSTSPSSPTDAYHTLTACRAPCNRSTGIAYPIANAARSFDSGQLGYNSTAAFIGAPAEDDDTWETPKNLKPGTYTYFCRVHPFMRGSFRVVK